MTLRSSIVVIGDEVLGGFVQDTNSGWLAQRLQAQGVPLDRVHTVPDDHDAIDEALQAELRRSRPRVVFTSGGVGSTPDDLTMEAVAGCLGVPVEPMDEINARITRALARSEVQGLMVTPDHEASMRRMALAPAGAYLLKTDPRSFGGIAVDVEGGARQPGGATIVILPGVPGELQRIVTEGVEPLLLRGRGVPQHVAELRHPLPESLMNPALRDVIAAFPQLHVGSYPGWECVIRLKGPEPLVTEAMGVLRRHLDALLADPSAEQAQRLWQANWS
jgi:nicotinamide-nucleotide amidase